jgi:SAM-dependent methyltransferase
LIRTPPRDNSSVTASPDDHGFPPGFFRRTDDSPDDCFYEPDRFVTHIDQRAVDAVGALYEHLGLSGRVLDLMSSWVSHFRTPPTELSVLGMNDRELAANQAATSRCVHDLNADPRLPFADSRFDAATCCVSIDYLTRPIEVFREVHRVLVGGGVFVCTFSNRCFPTKAIHGWLASDDRGRGAIVSEYFRRSGGWTDPVVVRCTPPGTPGDPLYAVWATSRPGTVIDSSAMPANPS